MHVGRSYDPTSSKKGGVVRATMMRHVGVGACGLARSHFARLQPHLCIYARTADSKIERRSRSTPRWELSDQSRRASNGVSIVRKGGVGGGGALWCVDRRSHGTNAKLRVAGCCIVLHGTTSLPEACNRRLAQLRAEIAGAGLRSWAWLCWRVKLVGASRAGISSGFSGASSRLGRRRRPRIFGSRHAKLALR
ncbi:hypothetical protein L1887_50558 [Cichorium endivia]|nr:hypothetical protein L1887_50558 [Cichorium endivia]